MTEVYSVQLVRRGTLAPKYQKVRYKKGVVQSFRKNRLASADDVYVVRTRDWSETVCLRRARLQFAYRIPWVGEGVAIMEAFAKHPEDEVSSMLAWSYLQHQKSKKGLEHWSLENLCDFIEETYPAYGIMDLFPVIQNKLEMMRMFG